MRFQKSLSEISHAQIKSLFLYSSVGAALCGGRRGGVTVVVSDGFPHCFGFFTEVSLSSVSLLAGCPI